MTNPSTKPKTLMLADFYKRLEEVEPIIRVVLMNARISALLTFRGEPEKRVVLDYTREQGRVSLDDTARDANIYVTIPGDVMHRALTGEIKPGEALARREMLLRGSASDLAKFIPLLYFGPLLYREHLADIGYNGFARYPGKAMIKEADMNDKKFTGEPISIIQQNIFEKAIFKIINAFAYVAGYAMGFMRHRLLKKLSLFDVLGAMSGGLQAASPKVKENSD